MDEPPSFVLLSIFSDQSLLYFILTAVFLAFAAWASAVEAAFFSMNGDDIDRLKNSNNEREKSVAALLRDARLLLSTLTLCKYVAIICATVLAVSSISFSGDYFTLDDFSVGAIVVILTFSFSLIGVILAKIFGATHNVALAKSNAGFSKFLIGIFKPFVRPLLMRSVIVEKKLILNTEKKTEEQLSQALQLATIDNEPIEGEKEILEGIVSFGTLKVKQIMRPAAEISWADISLDFFQLIEFIRKSGFSRVPVGRGSLDAIQGFLYIKDILPYLEQPAAFEWQKLLRRVHFVPEGKKVDLLLKEFQEKRVHLGLVVNQANKITGLVTLEDIIEEIVGDINDEFDEPGVRYQKINDRTYLFDAKASIHEFCKILNVDPQLFQPIKGINESLSSLLKEMNEGLPAIGDKILIDRFTFVIESVDQKRIKKIRVEIGS